MDSADSDFGLKKFAAILSERDQALGKKTTSLFGGEQRNYLVNFLTKEQCTWW